MMSRELGLVRLISRLCADGISKSLDYVINSIDRGRMKARTETLDIFAKELGRLDMGKSASRIEMPWTWKTKCYERQWIMPWSPADSDCFSSM
jgi:hypothetical protein